MTHKFNKIARQGDVLFIKVSAMPKNATVPCQSEHGQWIIAHSETGHHHVIDSPRAKVYEAADDAFTAWIKTGASGADVTHKREFHTHDTISLEPNSTYMARRQREHAPEGWRRAAD